MMKGIKILLWVLGTAVFTAGISYLLKDYAAKQAGNLLISLIAQKTENSYNVSFEQSEFHFISARFTLTNFHIEPKDEIANTSTEYVDVTLPFLTISIGSIKDMLVDKKLQLTNVSVNQPSVKVFNKQKDTNEEVSMEYAKIFGKLQEYLSAFSITSFSLLNGKISMHNPVSKEVIFEISDISLRLSDFNINFIEGLDGPQISSNGVADLKVLNEKFYFKDKTHSVVFDSLIYNSQSRSIVFYGFDVQPINDDARSEYAIKIPQMIFSGFDIGKVYYDQKIIFEQIIMDESSVFLDLKNQENTDKNNPSPAYVLSQLFETFQVNKLTIQNTDVHVRNINNQSNDWELKLTDFNVELKDIILDSAVLAATQQDWLLSTRFNASMLSMKLSERDTLFVTQPLFDGNERHFESGQWTYRSIRDHQVMVISGPLLVIDELDVSSLLNNKIFKADIIELSNTSVSINKTADPAPTSDVKSPTPILDIKKINLAEASILIKTPESTFSAGSITTSIGLKTNEKSDLKQIITQMLRADVVITQIRADAPSQWFQINQLTRKARSKEINVKGLTSKNINAADVQITGMDILAALENQLVFDTVRLKNGNIRISDADTTHNTKKSAFDLSKIQFQWAGLEKFDLSIRQKDQRINAQQLNVVILPDDEYGFAINDYQGISGSFRNKTFTINWDSLKRVNKNDVSLHKMIVKWQEGKNSLSLTADSVLTRGMAINGTKVILPEKLFFGNLSADINIIAANPQKKNDNVLDIPAVQVAKGRIKMDLPDVKATATINSLETPKGKSDDLLQLVLDGYFNLDSVAVKTKDADVNAGIVSLIPGKIKTQDLKIVWLKENTIRAKYLMAEFIKPTNFKEITLLKLQSENPDIRILKLPENQNNEQEKTRLIIKETDIDGGKFYLEDKRFKVPLSLEDVSLLAGSLSFGTSENLLQQLPKSVGKFSAANLSYPDPSGRYTMSLGKIVADITQKNIQLSDVAFTPDKDKDAFMEGLKYQETWNQINIKSMTLFNADIDGFLDGDVVADKAEIKGMTLALYKDKRLEENTQRVKTFPHVAIQNLPIKLKLDTIKLNVERLVYTEQNEGFERQARIFFNQINANVYNVTNDSVALLKNGVAKMDAKARMYQNAPVEIQGTFHLNNESGKFSLTGKLGNMDLTQLNVFLENSVSVKISQGLNKSMYFKFDADTFNAIGQMNFYYEDLKIVVLNRDKIDEDKPSISGFKSFFANTFIVNTKNPAFLSERVGYIYSEHIPYKGMIGFWAKAILSGTVSSIGAKNNRKSIRKFQKAKDKKAKKEGKE